MEVYIDNASTTKISKKAMDVMLPFFYECYGNPSSIHNMGQKANEAITEAREKIAEIINCKPKEIIFTSGGSESDNQAIISASKIGKKLNKKHIISTKIEHHAVLNTLKKLELEGFKITLLDVNTDGIVNIEDIKQALTKDTILVSVMTANNEIGTIQPIEEIGKICRENNIIFHTDAVQALGQMKIDVQKSNIDMLSASAHKFHGPKGIGILYAKENIELSNLIEGGKQERGKRAGTQNTQAIVGMRVALEEATLNLKEKQDKLKKLQDRLINGITTIPHSILNGDRTKRLSNNVNFSFEGIEGESLLLLLNERGIYASSGSACASGSIEPSHVLLAIKRDLKLIKSSLRLSLSVDNNEEEIDYVIKNIKEIVEYLRNISPVWQDLIEGKRQFITN